MQDADFCSARSKVMQKRAHFSGMQRAQAAVCEEMGGDKLYIYVDASYGHTYRSTFFGI